MSSREQDDSSREDIARFLKLANKALEGEITINEETISNMLKKEKEQMPFKTIRPIFTEKLFKFEGHFTAWEIQALGVFLKELEKMRSEKND